MAITKSAKKAFRQSQRRRVRNSEINKKMKNLLKETPSLESLPQLYKVLDKAAKAGIIKKNTASRKKSRLTKFVSKLDKSQQKI